MRSHGIELQNKISEGKKTVKNIETYTQELEVVIEDSQTEKGKYATVIENDKKEWAKIASNKKELDRFKRKITMNRER